MTRTVLLGDVSRYVNDKISVKDVSLDDYVSTENLLPDKGGLVQATNLPQKGKVTKYERGDVLVSNIRPYFKKIWYAQGAGGASNDVLVFRALSDEMYNHFLFYVLSNDKFFDYSTASSTGAKMPRGDKIQLMKYPLYQPGLGDQKKIVEILKAIDKKIGVNRRMNETLEKIGQALLKHYFIDNPETKSWPKRSLGEFFPVKTGKKDANFGTSDGAYPFFTCSQNVSKAPDYSFEGAALLLAGNGDFNLKLYRGKFEAYQRTYVLIPTDERLLGYLYFLMSRFLGEITGGSRGSVIKFITKGMIEDYKITAPDNKELLHLSEPLNLVTLNIEKNKEQISVLEEVRDSLQPRLISGKIKV